MIGTIRFILATLVVANHVYLPTANLVGAHAVAAFYMLSGYLMTKVIQEVYGTTARGTASFLTNRFLRIYPPYWFFLAGSLLLLWLFPATFGQTYSIMQLPQSGYDYFRNITLYDLANAPQIVIPPAWTLTVEMFFYLAMGLLLSRHRATVWLWFVASVAIHSWLLATGASFGQRYTPVHAASIFFSTGALIYCYRRQLQFLTIGRTSAWVCVAVFAITPLLVHHAGQPAGMIGFYGPAVLFVPILLTALNARSGEMDRWLGDLAYPVFITHLFAAGIIRIAFPRAIAPLSLVSFIASYLLCVAISALFVRGASRHLEPIRAQLRAAA